MLNDNPTIRRTTVALPIEEGICPSCSEPLFVGDKCVELVGHGLFCSAHCADVWYTLRVFMAEYAQNLDDYLDSAE